MCLQMNMLQLNCFSLFLCMVTHVEGGGGVDCEQSLFFFRFNLVGGVQAGLTDQEKKETMRSLWEGGERKIIF